MPLINSTIRSIAETIEDTETIGIGDRTVAKRTGAGIAIIAEATTTTGMTGTGAGGPTMTGTIQAEGGATITTVTTEIGATITIATTATDAATAAGKSFSGLLMGEKPGPRLGFSAYARRSASSTRPELTDVSI
jgi:hypothetical protein